MKLIIAKIYLGLLAVGIVISGVLIPALGEVLLGVSLALTATWALIEVVHN